MNVQKKELNLVQFWYKLMNIIGVQWVARTIAIVSIVFVSALLFAQITPSAGEAWIYNITLFSGVLTACLLAIICLMVLSVGVNITTLIIGAGIKQARYMNGGGQMLLPENTNSDLIIVENPGEFDFNGRVERELLKVPPTSYVAIIKFRTPDVFYIVNGKEQLMTRTEIAPDSNAISETHTEYEAFIETATAQITDHFRSLRMKSTDNVRSSFLNTSVRVLSVTPLIALLIALPVFGIAQSKTQRVTEGLPEIAQKVVTANTVLVYSFDRGELQRTSDGAATVAQLVAQNRAGADADNKGDFKGVTIGTTFFAAKQNEQQKPQSLFMESSMTSKNISIQIPDSVNVANSINQIKNAIPFYKGKLWAAVRPIIDLIYYLLWIAMPLLVGAIAFFNIVSRSAGMNGNLGASVQKQQVLFAALAWYCSIAVAGVLFVIFALTAFFMEWEPLTSIILIGAGAWLAIFVVNRLTPNGQYQRHVTTTSRSSGPGLNSGR